jgi:DNA-nicking Smr family endonuclease
MTKPPSKDAPPEDDVTFIMHRTITAHEKHLWKYVVRHDAPLHPPIEDEFETLDIDWYASDQKHKPVAALPQIVRTLPPELKVLQAGVYDGVDKRSADRLRRGQMKMDAVLDLHGLNQLDAFEQLHHTIASLYQHHKRTLLVITGKGQAGQGVLKQALPLWLNAASIRSQVLAFDAAQPKDGGSGAWYVLLKRQRKHYEPN